MPWIKIPIKLKQEIIVLHEEISKRGDFLISYGITSYSSGSEDMDAYVESSNYHMPVKVTLKPTKRIKENCDDSSCVVSLKDIKQYINELKMLLNILKNKSK
ncbi:MULTISPECIES: hypothetical protein [Entomomonas]|uniref:Uncharacterized protein n=1 Tax=Entomomonas asaccharolytica TaxID=2785331 RepID=A0A974NHN4_9GAMM|nr:MULTISPECIES: hypothetical protein [Entomomonas]QQP86818.1 hypothetical protein JHT90_06145 [Entomomonas asaccharolytica]UYZ83564.1 hypothetical protein MTZ49_13310 [Entomomonas sp. E2T0]